MSTEPDYYIQDLSVGMSASRRHKVTSDDIDAFVAVSGDDNPLHIDDAYAAKTPFGERIAHGMLSAAYISAVLGTQLPGKGAIYLGQTLKFKAPVKIGDTVETSATVEEILVDRRRATLKTVCKVGDTVVVEGEATIMLPSR